jgi:hypothetical protein
LACLGSPQNYQAWCDIYLEAKACSLPLILLYLDLQLAVYGSLYQPGNLSQLPQLDDSLPAGMINFFGPGWAESERKSNLSKAWPANWKAIEIKVYQH